MTHHKPIRIATRASELALVQAEEVSKHLRAVGIETELVKITTRGDRDRRWLWEIGGRGVFTKSLEDAILDGRADAAVHSAKDLPTQLPAGLVLAAALPRGDPRDAFVSAVGMKLAELAAGSVVGTSSPRRAAAVLRLRPDLLVKPIRGNVPTRLEKVEKGDFSGVILAFAGLKRLGLEKSITEVLEPDIMLPAAGQGAMVVEMAAEGEARGIFERISDRETLICIGAERAVLRELGAGCRAAVGALAGPVEGGFLLQADVLSSDGVKKWSAEALFEAGGEAEAGARVARELIERGAAEALGNGLT